MRIFSYLSFLNLSKLIPSRIESRLQNSSDDINPGTTDSTIAVCSTSATESVWNTLNESQKLELLADKINIQAEPNLQQIERSILEHYGNKDSAKRAIELFAGPLKANYPYSFKRVNSCLAPRGGKSLNVVFAKRSTGMKQIHSEISKVGEERVWIFIPSLSIWIDDTYSKDERNAGGDPYFRNYLSNLLPEIELIHTHPDKTLRHMHEEGSRSAEYLVEGAAPTSGDFISITQQHAQSNRNCRFIGSIVSHYGVTSYEMSLENLRFGEGGAAGSFTNGYEDVINPNANPINEIKRILEIQQNKCTYMIQLEPKKVPAFHIIFQGIDEL